MALGPGALSLLLQPTHVNNPARGDGVFQAARIQEEKQQNQWYRGQREQETAEQRRQFDVSHGLEQKKFDYLGQEKRRTEEMSAYDELLEAEASQDPQKMLAALNKARARGVTAPGYEEKINELFKSGGEKGKATQPEETPTAQPKPEAPTKGGIRGPIVGESIGDGWEVVDTPPEAMTEGEPPQRPAQWLTDEMEARGEIPVQPMPGWERSPFTGEMLPPLPQESVTTQRGMPPEGGPWNDGVQRGPVGPIQPIPNHTGGPQQPIPIPNHIGGPPGLRGGLPQGPVAPPEPQRPPGATVVYGSDGRPLGTVDPETAMARSRERVRAGLSSLVEQARTPEEKRAAAIAMDTGQRLVGSMPVDKIIINAQERYDAELGRDTAKTVARGGKEAGAPSAGSGAGSYTEDTGLESQDFRINDSARQIAEGLKRAYNTKALNEAVSANAAMVANAKARTGPQNLAAVKHMLQITEQGRLSNQDLEMALASGGKLNALHGKLMAWTAEGRLPPGYLKSVQAYGKTLQAIELEKRAEIYEEGLASIRANRLFASLSPEDQEWWAQWVAGYASNTMRRVKQKPLRKKGKKGTEQAAEAPAGDADAEADALMGGD